VYFKRKKICREYQNPRMYCSSLCRRPYSPWLLSWENLLHTVTNYVQKYTGAQQKLTSPFTCPVTLPCAVLAHVAVSLDILKYTLDIKPCFHWFHERCLSQESNSVSRIWKFEGWKSITISRWGYFPFIKWSKESRKLARQK